MQFFNLPTEIIVWILTNVHPMEIVLNRQVCRRFRDLIDASIELQLLIELGADGYLLGEHAGMIASDILKLVLERRRAFDELIPHSFWTFDFKHTQSIRREILEGVWGCSPDNRPEGTFRGIHFEELLPPTRSIALHLHHLSISIKRITRYGRNVK